jgi:hypothetical protein
MTSLTPDQQRGVENASAILTATASGGPREYAALLATIEPRHHLLTIVALSAHVGAMLQIIANGTGKTPASVARDITTSIAANGLYE